MTCRTPATYTLRAVALTIFLLAVWIGGNMLILPVALLGHWIADQLERRDGSRA